MSKQTETEKKETWTRFAASATDFASSDGFDEVDAMSITRLIEKGNANPKRQSRCTASIRTICMDIAGNPFGSHSSLNAAATDTVDAAQKAIAGIAALFNKGGSAVQGLLVPHGRTVVKTADGETVKDDDGNAVKKTHWIDGAELTTMLQDSMHDAAVRLQKAGWDGSVEGLTALIDGGSN